MRVYTQTIWVLALFTTGIGMCQDTVFSKTRLMAQEGKREKLVDVTLHFSGTAMALSDTKSSQTRLEIPYASISSITYERAKRRRTNEGAALGAVSLGGGLILMATKTESHWLEIQYEEGSNKKAAVLQLHKDEIDAALAECDAKCGRKVERLAADEHRINVTADSHNIDEVVSYPPEKVLAALKPAFAKYSCAITKEKGNEIECKRVKTTNSEITGIGGEQIKAKVEAKGSSTRVKIETDRGFNGKYGKKNWSTPVYKAMMENLKGPVPTS